MTLFIETASRVGGLLLFDPVQDQIFSQSWTADSSHSERITFELEELLKKSKRELSAIELLVVNIGPGSFTGIRVGLSFARSLSYMIGCKILSLNTLEVMAQVSPHHGKILVSLPAITGHHYVGGFIKTSDKIEEQLPPRSLSSKELEALMNDYDHLIDGKYLKSPTKVEDLFQFYRQKSRAFQKNSWNELMPLYLRRSQAEEKLSGGILKPLYEESGKCVEPNGQKQGGRS